MTDKSQGPECFKFALDFLGDPEAAKLRAYVEQLEARAALAAEPVAAPAGPTDEELALIYHDFCRGCEFMDQGGFEDAARTLLARWGHQPAPPAEGEVAELALKELERTVVLLMPVTGHKKIERFDTIRAALKRLQELENNADLSPAPVPVVADGEVAELVEWLKAQALAFHRVEDYEYENQAARAADLLSQRHPAPVPVSERLPGAEDCDAEGRCWWFSPADPSAGTFGVAACWVLRKHEPEDDFRTHRLPATALPLPQEEVE